MNLLGLPPRFCRGLVVGALLFLPCSADATADRAHRDALDPTVARVVPNTGAFHVRAVDLQATRETLAELSRVSELPRVWVYFTDKGIESSEALAGALAATAATLDERAASRRVRRSAPLDFHDVPVLERYVQQLESTGAAVHRRSRWLNAASIRAELPVLEAIARLPFVARLEPVRGAASTRGWLTAPPPGDGGPRPARRAEDPFDYGTSRDQLEQIRVLDAHRSGYTGAGVVVAMMDTGFFHEHPTFQEAISSGRLLAQYDFVKDDGETQNEPGDAQTQHHHGTYTWSALGGYTPGELVGPAFGASFLLAKTEDIESETPVEEDNWIAAAEWADALGADIISTSLTYTDWYTYENMDGDTAPITIAADLCPSRGILVFGSAGNLGAAEWYYIGAPADGDSVVAVGAVDANNEVAYFSAHGPTFDGRVKPEVVARGIDTYCAVPPTFGLDYFWVSGTSLSCPLVAGAAALVLEAHPSWTPMMLRSALLMTADSAHAPDYDRGYGLIDTWAAIGAPVDAGNATIASGAPFARVSPNPSSNRFRLEWGGRPPGGPSSNLTIHDAGGREVFQATIDGDRSVFEWDGRDRNGAPLPAGVYHARLRTGEWSATARLVRIP